MEGQRNQERESEGQYSNGLCVMGRMNINRDPADCSITPPPAGPTMGNEGIKIDPDFNRGKSHL